MSMAIGDLESQLFAYVQMRRLRTIRSGELVRALGMTPVQEREVLSRLARRSLIARVRRGLYLVPPRLPPGGKWSPGGILALSTLIEDRNGRYQICGPSAFSRYGWEAQVPNRIYAYNNRISGERQIGAVSLSLIKVSDQRLGGTDVTRTPEGVEAVYASRIRSLVDAIYDWSRFGSLPQAYQWIRAELARDEKAASKLARMALDYGNVSTIRRLGKLLDLEGVKRPTLSKLERALRPSTAWIAWNPSRPKRGEVDRRWGVVFHE